jgi:hypothetical protein
VGLGLRLFRPPVVCAEAEVTVSAQRSHAESVRKIQREPECSSALVSSEEGARDDRISP